MKTYLSGTLHVLINGVNDTAKQGSPVARQASGSCHQRRPDAGESGHKRPSQWDRLTLHGTFLQGQGYLHAAARILLDGDVATLMAEPMCISEPELSLSLRSVVTGSKTVTVTSLAAVNIGSAVRIVRAAGIPEFHVTRTCFSRSAWTLFESVQDQDRGRAK